MVLQVIKGQMRKKGVVTFNCPALTGQISDREVNRGPNGPKTWVGWTCTQKASQSWDQPLSLPVGLTSAGLWGQRL